MLLVHQGLMKLASSGALGQQALQTVLSQLPGKTTVEQGTATDESYICQEKLLDQRPKLSILSNYVVGNFNVVRWRLLGTSLEVPQEVLSHIVSTLSCCEDRYLEVLNYWLSHNEAANWRTLLEVLGHFETKNTLDKLLQEVLATQDSQVSGTWKMYSAVYQQVKHKVACVSIHISLTTLTVILPLTQTPPNSTTRHSEPFQHCPGEFGMFQLSVSSLYCDSQYLKYIIVTVVKCVILW